jgi:hypothetical protein
MADRMLFLSWGQVVRGREERALEVFNESMGFYGRLQQEGRIESFDVVLLEPHAGGLAGYIEVHGSTAQLDELRADGDFRRLQVDVSMIVDDLGVVDGFVGEGVARQMAMYADAIAKVPQRT